VQRKLAEYFTFTHEDNDDFLKWTALNGRVQFWLKKNPTRAILHTVQVERNGYIHTVVSGTENDQNGYIYYGDHVYDELSETAAPKISARFFTVVSAGRLRSNSKESNMAISQGFRSRGRPSTAPTRWFSRFLLCTPRNDCDSLYYFPVPGNQFLGSVVQSESSPVTAGTAAGCADH
jgi:hypothetical protein